MESLDARTLSVRPQLLLALYATLLVSGGAYLSLHASGVSTLAGPAAVERAQVATLTNDERASRGEETLARNPLLDRAAQLKADDMAARGYYAHVTPDGKIPPYFAEQVGYRYRALGENLVIDRDSADEVVSAWMDSTAHRENILNPIFTEIGIGVADGQYEGHATTFVVELLAAPARSATAPAKPVSPVLPVSPSLASIPAPSPISNIATASVATSSVPVPAPMVTPTAKVVERTPLAPILHPVKVPATTGARVISRSVPTLRVAELSGQLGATTPSASTSLMSTTSLSISSSTTASTTEAASTTAPNAEASSSPYQIESTHVIDLIPTTPDASATAEVQHDSVLSRLGSSIADFIQAISDRARILFGG